VSFGLRSVAFVSALAACSSHGDSRVAAQPDAAARDASTQRRDAMATGDVGSGGRHDASVTPDGQSGSPVITTMSLPAGSRRVAYNAALAAMSGRAPYAWSLSGGTLPDGLSLDAASGTIAGVPTAVGNAMFNVTVKDADDRTASHAFTLAVTMYGGKTVGVFNTTGSGHPYLPNWTSAAGPSNTNLELVCNGVCQTSTQNVGVVGSAGSTDADWQNTNWSTLTSWGPSDNQLVNMTSATERVLNVYSAPFWMLGDPQGNLVAPQSATAYWSTLTSYSVADSQVTSFADFVHYMVLRYTGNAPCADQATFAAHPITHLTLWSEMQGYYDGAVVPGGYYRFDRYAVLFNAVWARLKVDPLTSAVKLGGPYVVAISTGVPAGQTPDISGAWGAVDSRITQGIEALAGLRTLTLGSSTVPALTGLDFLVADLGDAPSGLTKTLELQRFTDIIHWYKTVPAPVFNNCPVMIQEIYWAEGPSALPDVLDTCFNAGADSVYLFHQSGGTPGLACLLVDTNGAPTDAYSYLAGYSFP